MTKVFIYGLADPSTLKIRYVGKSKHVTKRFYCHLRDKSQRRLGRWVRSLEKEKIKPLLVIIDMVNEEVWEEAERFWIARHREEGYDLTNHTDGGDGVTSLDSEARLRISESRKQKWADPEFRKKMREITQRPERNRKISAFHRGRPKSAAHVAKLPQNQKGYKHSEEFKRKISAAHKGNKYCLGRKLSAEHKAKLALALRGNQHTKGRVPSREEKVQRSSTLSKVEKSYQHKQRISEGAKELWAKRKACGFKRAEPQFITWPDLAVLEEKLRTCTSKEVAKEIGVKPGTLAAFLHRQRKRKSERGDCNEQLHKTLQPEIDPSDRTNT